MSEGLTLEQQFNLRSFRDQISRMSREQAIDFLGNLYEQMMLRESMYKHFLKHQWGIGESPSLDDQAIVEEHLKRLIDCGEIDYSESVDWSVKVKRKTKERIVAFIDDHPEMPEDELADRAVCQYLEKHGGY